VGEARHGVVARPGAVRQLFDRLSTGGGQVTAHGGNLQILKVLKGAWGLGEATLASGLLSPD
jgi:hypothetical protein